VERDICHAYIYDAYKTRKKKAKSLFSGAPLGGQDLPPCIDHPHSKYKKTSSHPSDWFFSFFFSSMGIERWSLLSLPKGLEAVNCGAGMSAQLCGVEPLVLWVVGWAQFKCSE